MIDIEKLIAGVHEYVKPLVQRIKVLEDRPAPKDGADGKDGKDADVSDVKSYVDTRITNASLEILKATGESLDSRIETAILSLEKAVPQEEVQRLIEDAVAKRMADIRMPKDGEPGRDGAHLEILPAIAQDKSYPRGTYAKHDGGLWRSFESTEGMRGWECIVDGVADVKLEAVEREFTVTTRRSSGAEEVKTISLPVMLYRGVYKEGQEYLGGDTVTWGGSLWHCDSNTADKPGELGSKGWTLAAKRGRDGKDGVNGKDYTKAVAL